MQLADAMRKRIKNLMRDHDMKPYDLSRAAGIALPTFTDFMKGDTKNLRIDTVLHICEAFNISLKEFFDDSVFKDVISE